MHRIGRPRAPSGEVRIVRYVDAAGAGFQCRRDAESFTDDRKERLDKSGLRLHSEKTRPVECGRFAAADRKRRGQGRPEAFDLLGFTHFVTTTGRGSLQPGRGPIVKRMRSTLGRVRGVLRKRIHHAVRKEVRRLGQVVDGWTDYCAVPGSSR